MAQERKVRRVMTDAGLYKEGTKDQLRSDFISEEEIQLAGKSYTLSKISYLDSRIFTDELDTILVQQNPLARAPLNPCLELTLTIRTASNRDTAFLA